MMLFNKHANFFLAVAAGFICFFVGSCAIATSSADAESVAEVELTNGTVFTFTLPTSGKSEIVAQKTTSHSSSATDMYSVSALSALDVPYDAFTLELTPAQINAEGEIILPSAVVRVTTYSASTDDAQIDGNYKPKSRTFYLTSATNLSSACYRLPTNDTGTFTFSWSVDEEDAVLPEEAYTDYTFKSYSVKQILVVVKGE